MKTMKNNINKAAISSVILSIAKDLNTSTADNLAGGNRSFTAFRMTILAIAVIVSSCTQDSITPEYADAPLTISATIPGDVWAVASRADDGVTDAGVAGTAPTYSDWTLHYTDYTGAAAAYALTADAEDGTNVSFTTGEDLVWAKVDATRPMHLTALYDNGTPDDTADDYTLHTSVASATAGTALAFPDAMKPTVAMLTVNFALSHNMATAPAAKDFTITVDAQQKGDYSPYTDGGVWPAHGMYPTTTFKLFEVPTADANAYTVTGTMLLPQQTMRKELKVTYGSNTWKIDLSNVTVSGSSIEQRANQLFAGQHLTLNLSASLISVDSPTGIEIEAFTAADEDSYENDLGGTAKKSNL